MVSVPKKIELSQPQKVPLEARSVSKTDDTPKVRAVTNVKVESEFKASASELFDCLHDAKRIAVWTGESPKYTGEANSEFSLFGGAVSGILVESVPGKKLVQKWRLKQWPKDHFSVVTIDLVQGSNSTVLKVHQVGPQRSLSCLNACRSVFQSRMPMRCRGTGSECTSTVSSIFSATSSDAINISIASQHLCIVC